jgi:hypothetical protein
VATSRINFWGQAITFKPHRASEGGTKSGDQLNSSRTLRAGAVCWRYAFVILKFLVADISVNKAAVITSIAL